MLDEFSMVFTIPNGLPLHNSHDHGIHLQLDRLPISVQPYHYPYYQKIEIDQQVKEFLDSGIIQPSCSPYSSFVLLVKKIDGSWRFYVDYRALNDITIKDKYPIPVIDELLDKIFRAKYFSKLDLRSGYCQIRVCEKNVQKTAFCTHEGHYKFVVRLLD